MSENFEKEKQPPVEAAIEKIMSAKEYAELGTHEVPYNYEIDGKGKTINYFGAEHSYDPENPQFQKIDESFEKFKLDLVLVEGQSIVQAYNERTAVKDEFNNTSREELIQKCGEVGFAMKIAINNDIEVETPEPNFKEEIEFVEARGFSQEDIFTYYIFRQLPHYHSRQTNQDFNEYIKPTIEEFKSVTQREGFDYSVDLVDKVNKKLYGEKINFNDPESHIDKTDPIPWDNKKDQQTEINKVAAASSLYRDKNIIKTIAKHLENHEKIFIVYGASHAVMQEAALRELLEN